MSNDMDDLDAFLGQAVARQSATSAIEQAQNKRLGAIRGSDEWRTANAVVQAWERKNEWTAVTYQARLSVEVCACGGIAETFDGFFHVIRHRTRDSVEHKRARVEDIAGVDLETIDRVTERRHVDICIECWTTKGKKNEEEIGTAGTDRIPYAGDAESSDGHGAVVERRSAGAVWASVGVPLGAGESGLGKEERGDGE